MINTVCIQSKFQQWPIFCSSISGHLEGCDWYKEFFKICIFIFMSLLCHCFYVIVQKHCIIRNLSNFSSKRRWSLKGGTYYDSDDNRDFIRFYQFSGYSKEVAIIRWFGCENVNFNRLNYKVYSETAVRFHIEGAISRSLNICFYNFSRTYLDFF